MNVRCIETCYIDGFYYEAGKDYVLTLARKHPSWAYFKTLGQDEDAKEEK